MNPVNTTKMMLNYSLTKLKEIEGNRMTLIILFKDLFLVLILTIPLRIMIYIKQLNESL